MPTYIEVAVNVSQIQDVFHYHLPPELEGLVQPGSLLEVPFGRQIVQGVALRFVDTPSVAQTRPVRGLVDANAVIPSAQIALAQHLAHATLSPLAACIQLMLPPGLGKQADVLYSLQPVRADQGRHAVTDSQTRLLDLLEQRGPLRGRQIDQALPHKNWRQTAAVLVKRGILSTEPVLQQPVVRPKIVRTVQLACPPQVAEAAMDNVARAGSPALQRRQAILRFLIQEPAPVDVSWVYAHSGAKLEDLRKLADLDLVALGESEVLRDSLSGPLSGPLPLTEFQTVERPLLTPGQQVCWEQVQAGIAQVAQGNTPAPYLLHGVTGSGKTEIYLRAVEAVLALGKQAIVLVPEIALTPQTVSRFISRFPGQVGLVHSQLSEGERYDTWRRARAGKLGLVVGPRSALFTPFPNIGLLVLDECHDDSYYQDDPPFYDARDAALAYARLTGALCLLGSATPDVTSTYRASQGEYHYLRLTERVPAYLQYAQPDKAAGAAGAAGPGASHLPQELPQVQVVDMRLELQSGNRSIFSQALQAGLSRVLANRQQAILFLNRRGTATYVFCRDCGYTVKCPKCDLPMVFHGPQEALTCHHCGYRRKMPVTCPECKSTRIRQYGIGTERVETEVLALFPQARILRWDYETTRKKGAHDAILSQFSAHRADILVGTQMLAKGLDLPLVTLVGVVLADVGLNMPDYRSAERTFQVLTQVAGRAGRSPLGGDVVLQTFQPENYVLQSASHHNYRDFYLKELEYRRQLGYPPFNRLLRLEYRHERPAQAEAAAQKLAAQIKGWIADGAYRSTELLGPMPCSFPRLGGLYRWQIILRGPNPADVLRGRPLPEWRVQVDPPSLL